MSQSPSQSVKCAQKWLNLNNYKPISKFTALQWIDQLIKRQHILELLKGGNESALNEKIGSLMKWPLAEYLQFQESFEKERSRRVRHAVAPLTFEDVDSLCLGFQGLPFRTADNSLQPLEDAVLSLKSDFSLFLQGNGYLKVSLAATDSEILAGVKGWLSYRRSIDAGVLAKEKVEDLRAANCVLLKNIEAISDIFSSWIFHENISEGNSRNALSEIRRIVGGNVHIFGGDEKLFARLSEHLYESIDVSVLAGLVEKNVDSYRIVFDKLRGSYEEHIALNENFIALCSENSRHAIEKRGLKKEMASWEKCGVLPFFDLYVWAQWKGVTLSREDMILVLLEPYEDGRRIDRARAAFSKLFESDFAYQLLAGYFG
jgi:hypothetical protein